MPLSISRRTTWISLALIIILGAVLRFQAIATTVVVEPIQSDASVYYFSALNIDRWGIFSRAAPSDLAPSPDAFVQPGLPLAIVPLIEFPHSNRMLLRINLAQAALGTLTILLTFAFFNLFSAPLIALGAALATALSPHLVSMTTYLLTETLFTFLLMSGMLSLGYALKVERRGWALLAGLLFGLSALTRATTEYLPLFMLPFFLWITDRQIFKKIIVPAALSALGIVVAWKLRNLIAIGSLSDPTLFLKALQFGMYPDFMYDGIPESLGYPYLFDPFAESVNDTGSVLSELARRAVADPLKYAYWYLVGKPITLLSWGMIEGIGDIFVYRISASPYLDHPLFIGTRLLLYWLHVPLSIAAVVGCTLTIIKPHWLGLEGKHRLPALLITLLVGYFFVIHMIGAPLQRYGIPLRPLVYGFGLFTTIALAKLLLARRTGWSAR